MSINYSRMTYNNKWWLKRWSHGARFQIALDLTRRFAPDPRRALDYGAGDGYFAQLLRGAFPRAEITAYDPSRSMAAAITSKAATDPEIVSLSCERDLRGPYDVIFCLEVLEHLQDEEILRALGRWREMLQEGGSVIVSVPIETGPGGLLKTAARLGIRESHTEGRTTWEICKAIWGAKIDRGKASYIGSHVGFSHSRLRQLLLRGGTTIRRTRYSPLPWTGPVNSQCFWVLNFS